MKKPLFFLFFFFFLFVNVSAYEIPSLKSIEIYNGTLSPEFTSLNTNYTVEISETTENLEIAYEVDDRTTVEIKDNISLENGSVVHILVTKNKETVTYNLLITKEEQSLATFQIPSSTPKKERSPFLAPSLIFIWFLGFSILFYLFFIFKGFHLKK